MTRAPAALTDLEAGVLETVDERWLVDRLRAMVAVPSVGGSPAESEVQHLLAGWLDELGCDVDREQTDLEGAPTAADAPGQEVERREAWGVVGTFPAADDGRPAGHPVRSSWTGGAFASGQLPPGHPRLPGMQRAVADTGAGVPVERTFTGGRDLRLYPAADAPTLHYGPGDLPLAHGPLEKVPLAGVVTAARASALLILRTRGLR